MDTTALIAWQSLLRSSPADRQSALLRCISPSLSAELGKLPSMTLDIPSSFEPTEELSQIHFSWIAPVLRSFPENEIKLFLSILNEEQVQGLKHSLLLSNTLAVPTPVGIEFLKKTLFEMIAGADHLPIPLLPKDPLNALLELSREELNLMIDLLSMHDLSIEIRHIIDTVKLKEIQGLLTKAQTTLLKTLLHKKEPVSFKKMALVSWNGDREALKAMLMQRGVNRIAKSLYGKAPSLLWHIAHRLDVERGLLLTRLCSPLDHPKASALLTEQVIELMSSFKTPNPL